MHLNHEYYCLSAARKRRRRRRPPRRQRARRYRIGNEHAPFLLRGPEAAAAEEEEVNTLSAEEGRETEGPNANGGASERRASD